MEIKVIAKYETVHRKMKEVSLNNFDEIIEKVLKILKYYLPIKETDLDGVISEGLYEELQYSGDYHKTILKEDFDYLDDDFELTIQNIDEIIEYIKSKIPKDWIDSNFTVAILQPEIITIDNSIFKNKEEEELFKSSTKKEKEDFIRERTAHMQKYQIRIC